MGALLPVLGIETVDQPFDVITMLGFLIPRGVMVDSPVLIVDRTLHNLRRGVADPVEAVREDVATRIRSIVMSVLNTLFGLSPLMFVSGAGTELYRGLGGVMLFGLLFATVVTLTFLRALLATVLEARARLSGRRCGTVRA